MPQPSKSDSLRVARAARWRRAIGCNLSVGIGERASGGSSRHANVGESLDRRSVERKYPARELVYKYAVRRSL
jgi:hypothetical protein